MLQLLMSIGTEAATVVGGLGEAGCPGKAKGLVFGSFLAAAEGRRIEVASGDAMPPEIASLETPEVGRSQGEGQPGEAWFGAMASMVSQPAATVPAEGGPSRGGDGVPEGGDLVPVSEVSPVDAESSARPEMPGAHKPDAPPGSTPGRELRNGAGVSVVPGGWSGEGVARAMAHASENVRFLRAQAAPQHSSTQPTEDPPEEGALPPAVGDQVSSPTGDGETEGPNAMATARGEGARYGAAGLADHGDATGLAGRRPAARTAESTIVAEGRPSGEPQRQQGIPTVGVEGRPDTVAHRQQGIPVVGEEGRPDRVQQKQQGIPVVGAEGRPDTVAHRQQGIPIVGEEGRPDRVQQKQQGIPVVGAEGRPDTVAHRQQGIPIVGEEGRPDRVQQKQQGIPVVGAEGRPDDSTAQGQRGVPRADAPRFVQLHVDGGPAAGPTPRGPMARGRVDSQTGRPLAWATGQVDAGGSVEAPGVGSGRWADARPGEIVGQLLVHTARLSTLHNSHLRVQLKPPHLGALELKLALKEGVLTLEIQTELARTRDLIEMALPQLRLALGERGIDLGKLSLVLAPASTGDSPSALAPGSPGAFVLDAHGGGGGRQPTPEQSPVGGREQKSADSPGQPADGEQADRHLVDYRI